ncbi:hypothetical protein N8290_04565 [Pseudomonadales bacterium]|nr:hypothetical protein [Pseudomonadales bacterium]
MHIAYDDQDLYDIDLIFKEWRRKGMVGSEDKSPYQQGYVSISTANWKKNDGSYVIMELHKIHGEKGLFRSRKNWVVRLLSTPFNGSSSVTTHGCVNGRTQLAALDRALLDVGYNFMSQTKLEDYYTR